MTHRIPEKLSKANVVIYRVNTKLYFLSRKVESHQEEANKIFIEENEEVNVKLARAKICTQSKSTLIGRIVLSALLEWIAT